jgi:2-isopropylmalate synthase
MIKLFDTTLRDGSQAEGISFSPHDKLRIALELDRLGVNYIEGGWPGSNPKDIQFFKDARKIKFKHARLTAFGSTRRKDSRASDDANLKAIAASGAPVACIFGKSWDMQVTHALRTTLDENVAMIHDSVKFLRSKKLDVIYDAEHFFDGYRANPDYALKTLQAALDGGASNLTLCDTNGGSIPSQITEAVRAVLRALPRAELGIHTHNDSGCAVANALAAIEAGCTLVQGVVNGFGERCGNADITTLIANLKLKMNYNVVTDEQLRSLTGISRVISEIANMVPNDKQPYVGNSAFAHKGGVHVSAVSRYAATYEHIDPGVVGNQRRILVSELSGKSNVLMKSKALEGNEKASAAVLELLKKKELEGYHFEGAEASFELLVQRALGKHKPAFDLESYRVTVEGAPLSGEKAKGEGGVITEATVKLRVGGKSDHTVGEGDGPVNALDNALRRALEKFYPSLKQMSLTDFKVRVVNASAGTAAKVRVLIESRDHKSEWTTMGVSTNLIEASWLALVDAVEYKLHKDAVRPKR